MPLENGEGDAAIYAIEHSALKKADKIFFGASADLDEIYKKTLNINGDIEEAFIYTFEPKFSNERIMAQQGVFLMPNFLKMSHQGILQDYDFKQRQFVKYIIPKNLRASGIRHLYQMNVTANIVYPGLEGFCKSMRHQPLFGLIYQRRVE